MPGNCQQAVDMHPAKEARSTAEGFINSAGGPRDFEGIITDIRAAVNEDLIMLKLRDASHFEVDHREENIA
jgi:hypothetical protein